MRATSNPIAQQIKTLRSIKYGENQPDFAKRVGIGTTTLSRYESGSPPKLPTLRRLLALAKEVEDWPSFAVFQESLRQRESELVTAAISQSSASPVTGIPVADLAEADRAMRGAALMWANLKPSVIRSGDPPNPDREYQLNRMEEALAAMDEFRRLYAPPDPVTWPFPVKTVSDAQDHPRQPKSKRKMIPR